MRFVRFGEAGRERPGVLTGDGADGILDLSTMVADLDRRFWGEGGVEFVARELDSGGLAGLARADRDSVRIGPPVARPGKIVCIGLNYMEHIDEQEGAKPKVPMLFSKAVTAVVGPNDSIVLPREEKTTDWEVELAVVIGRRARRVSAGDAMGHVAGFTILNDVSERGPQKSEGQFHRAKSFDTFAPLGPWVATPDEVGDPQALDLWLEVNGTRMQEANTRQMIHSVAELIEFISRNVTLEPGDIVSTGTPSGVGFFRDPPVFLKAGDVVEAHVEKLGHQRSPVIAEE
ncbi:MAG: fumarylacetoacetate hydrolase family protein [Planctomycetota bacterium]|jgi:2,4-diketo-3-deoxy-L-fuconate hydrolase